MTSSNEFYVDGNNHQLYTDESSEYTPSPFQYEQQIEEERLRGDIFRYLGQYSNGAYHFSAEFRSLTRDVVGIDFKATREEFEETESSLLDLLSSDPQRRFSIIGEGDHIVIKCASFDKDEISNIIEEWRCLIADFLFISKRVVSLRAIRSSIARPVRIPTSVTLISIMKTDPLNRFIFLGDGNAVKVKYNMPTDPDQKSLWIAKWRDDIASLLNRKQWSRPSVGLKKIEAHVKRPIFLQQNVELLEVLAADPLQRFVIIGCGADTHITIRNCRGDEPQIEEYVEQWRLLIADHLISKSAIQGITGSHPFLGLELSQVGAFVPRPPGVPGSVKLIDVMLGDPVNRFLISREGSVSRAMMVNSFIEGQMIGENMHYQNMDRDQEEYGRVSQHNNNNDTSNIDEGPVFTMEQKQHQLLDSHAEWKARLGNSGSQNQKPVNQNLNRLHPVIYGGQGSDCLDYGQGSGYGGQGSNSAGYGGQGSLNRQNNSSRDSMDHQNRSYNPNNPPRMANRAPVCDRDQYQYQEERNAEQYRDDRESRYKNQQSQSHMQRGNNLLTLSPLQQGHMLPGSNDGQDNQYFNDSIAPVDWNSLSQKEFVNGMEKDAQYLSLIPPRAIDVMDGVSLKSNSNDDKSLRSIGERIVINETRGSSVEGDLSLSSCHGSSNCTDRDNSSNYSITMKSSAQISSNNSDSGGLGSLFSGSGGYNNCSPLYLSTDMNVNRQGESNLAELKMCPSTISDDSDQFLSPSIPLDKWMIKTWLPIAFNGFDYAVIDVFVAKLRNDGGFVTLQDLLDAQSKGELTRELLADIAGFKVGHCNRLEKALAAYR